MISLILHAHEFAALGEGRLSQIRRPVVPQPQPHAGHPSQLPMGSNLWEWWSVDTSCVESPSRLTHTSACPLGAPGKRLRIAVELDGYWPAVLRALETVSVRAERLQSYMEADAIAEGCPGEYLASKNWYRPIWDAAHPEFPWAGNPWTWVAEVKEIH